MLSITINNWDKYNPRKDVANPSWFRMENSVFFDEKFMGFDCEEKLVWFFLLSYASFKSPTFRYNPSYISRHSGVVESKVRSSVEKLASEGCIKVKEIADTPAVRARNADVTDTLRERYEDVSLRDDTIRDVTKRNETNNTRSREKLNFEILYQKYPRKMGKTQGLKICKRDIKTSEDCAKLSEAIDRFSKHCSETEAEPKFIKYFSTFMGHWRDWLDPDVGTGPPGAGRKSVLEELQEMGVCDDDRDVLNAG